MATLNLGRIKPVFRGAYAGGTAYVVDDIVTSGNETFICILPSTGNATSNATYWTKLAAKGTDGTDVGATLTTQGDILYRDGSGLQRLAKPASDKFLQNTSGGVVSWESLSSDWVKIAQTNLTSSAASVDFIHGTGGVVIDSTYRIYKVFGSWLPASNGEEIRLRVANAGTFRTTDYLAEAHRSYYTGGTSRGNATDFMLKQIGGTQADSEQRSNFEATFFNMSDADHNTTAFWTWACIDGSGNSETQVNQGTGGGVYKTAEAHNGIRIYPSGGDIGAGEFTLIGIKG